MMAELAAEACAETRQDSPRVGEAEAAELLTQIPEWRIVNDAIDRLERSYRFGSFAEALAFTDRVGAEAEEQNHHPEIVTSYGQTSVRWWTHTVGGLHRNDFIMAARCDAIAAEQPQAMGRIIHFEILGDDPARLAEFYGQSLGWQFQVWDEPQPYWLATTRPDKGMGIDGAIMHRHFPQAVINMALVDSLEATLAAIAANGGKLFSGPDEIPGVGTFAYCEDPEGNLFGVIQEPTSS